MISNISIDKNTDKTKTNLLSDYLYIYLINLFMSDISNYESRITSLQLEYKSLMVKYH